MDRLKDIFYTISTLRKDLGRDIHQAAEELGEVAKAYRALKYAKTDLDVKIDDLKEEACDLIICGLAIYYGASPETCDVDEMYETMTHKLEKWKKQN